MPRPNSSSWRRPRPGCCRRWPCSAATASAPGSCSTSWRPMRRPWRVMLPPRGRSVPRHRRRTCARANAPPNCRPSTSNSRRPGPHRQCLRRRCSASSNWWPRGLSRHCGWTNWWPRATATPRVCRNCRRNACWPARPRAATRSPPPPPRRVPAAPTWPWPPGARARCSARRRPRPWSTTCCTASANGCRPERRWCRCCRPVRSSCASSCPKRCWRRRWSGVR